MSGLMSRVEKLEWDKRAATEETIIYINCFAKANHTSLPAPETEITRQRAEGRRIIVVEVPAEIGGAKCRA